MYYKGLHVINFISKLYPSILQINYLSISYEHVATLLETSLR